MNNTACCTTPLSYQQVTQSTWTCPLETDRASHRAERFTDWDADTSKPDGFVVQLVPTHAPASIVGRFGEGGFGQLHTGHVPHGNEACPSGNGRHDLVRPIFAGV